MNDTSFRHALSALLILLSAISFQAAAGDPNCKRTSVRCIDDTPCRDIGGNRVCLTDIGEDCWVKEDVFVCVRDVPADASSPCSAYENDPNCSLSSSYCSMTDRIAGTGACMERTLSWNCGP